MTKMIYSDPTTQLLTNFFIGFDRLQNDINDFNIPESKYPPYNIVKKDTEHYSIELAVAGFDPSEISITTQNGNLTIVGKAHKEDKHEYVYRGMAMRDFTRTFRLFEYVVVTDAIFHNGILTINLERQLPEHLKTQNVKIIAK